MKKIISTILMILLSISIVIFTLGDKFVVSETSSGQKRADILQGIILSTKEQFAASYNRKVNNADELIAYANHLSKNNAISIWDSSYDCDEIRDNTFSKNRIFADGNYILFQTKADADKQTNTLILYNINTDTLETVTDRSTNFGLLDQMDKHKNDNILQDGLGHTVSRSQFMNTPSIKILLKNDKFELTGVKGANGKNITAKKVTINKQSICLVEGDHYQLTAIFIPGNVTDQRVIWSSSNNAISSVDKDGNITAKKFGKAKITATTLDGKKTAFCQVTVNRGSNSYKPGQTATLYCAAGYGPIEWVSLNTATVIILSTNGQYCTIKCLKSGTATIIAYVHSYPVLYDSITETFIKDHKIEDYAHYNITVYK
jgi:hypothetical protein